MAWLGAFFSSDADGVSKNIDAPYSQSPVYDGFAERDESWVE